MRLESFLFTEQAFAVGRATTSTDDGVFVLYNYYREPWLVTKIATMLEDAFGARRRCCRPTTTCMAAIADGPLVAALNGGPPPGDTVDPIPEVGRADAPGRPRTTGRSCTCARRSWPTTTSWRWRIMLLGAFIAVALAARVTGTSFRRFSPHFFVLGIAFLLLETRSLVSFSLLFGTTWLVNALAFFGVLAERAAGHLHQLEVPDPAAQPALRRALRVHRGGLPAAAREPAHRPAGAALRCSPRSSPSRPCSSPTWCSATRSATPARRTWRSPATCWARWSAARSEYLALITGYQALLLVVAGLYGLAWLFATRFRRMADRELETESDRGERHAMARRPPSRRAG